MTTEQHINYWLESAEHDLDTARTLFDSGKYDWCLFISHLVLEKLLKAIFVKNNENKIPPKIHNLVRLAQAAKADLDEEQLLFLNEVNDFNLEVRYPEYKNEFYKICTKEFTEGYFTRIKEFYKWQKSLLT
jgi:HEPN domain-containing protein